MLDVKLRMMDSGEVRTVPAKYKLAILEVKK